MFDNSYFNITLQSLDCIYVGLLFIDNAWISIYGDTATKTSIDYGYTIIMDVNMSKYVDFVMAECESREISTEGLFEDGDYRQRNKDEGSVSLVIRFDKSLNILGLDFVINSLGYNGTSVDFYKSKILISKYNQNFTAPSWFNQENFQ